MESVFGFLILLLVFGYPILRIIMWIVGQISGGGGGGGGGGRSFSPMMARVRWIAGGADEPDRWDVEFKGQLMLVPNRKIAVHHLLLDSTNPSDRAPVIALLDWQQAKDSVAFHDVTDLGKAAPGDFLSLDDWTSLKLPIFPEMVKGPYSGQRKMTSLLFVATDQDEVLWDTEVVFTADLPVAGYIEDSERERSDDDLIVRMAVAVAAAAGDVTEAELGAIQHWGQARLAYLDDDSETRAERAEIINGSLTRSVSDATSGRLDLGATISRFLAEGSEGGRIEAVELCLAVMRADGTADRGELELINRLADQFEIDPTWFAENRDKSISGLATETDSASDYSTLLGIDTSADRETISRQLTEQYDRWLSRSESIEDPEKRREAEEMLDLIGKARAELLA